LRELQKEVIMTIRAIVAAAVVLAVSNVALGEDWTNRYNGAGNGLDSPAAIVLTPGGIPYIAGMATGDDGSPDMLTIKYNAATGSSTAAVYHYLSGSAEFDDAANDLAVTSSGNVYAAGHTTDTVWEIDGEDTLVYYFQRVTLVKYDANLTQQWVRHIPPDEDEEEEPDLAAWAVATRGDTAYLAGEGLDDIDKGLDVVVAKYAPGGTPLWEKLYNGNANGDDGATCMALDEYGNVYAAGYTWMGNATGQQDILVMMCAGPDGDIQWTGTYDGPSDSTDVAKGILVEGSYVFVTGVSRGVGTDNDFVTIKYSTSGSVQWARRYNGVGSGPDSPSAIAVDEVGNVIVVGYITDSIGKKDYLTIKYDPYEGDTLWVRRYNGPANDDDEALAVAVDEDNSVYVAGYRTTDALNTRDYWIVRYSAAGVLQDTWPYHHGSDEAQGVAVDTAGVVYFTGTSAEDVATARREQTYSADIAVTSILSPGAVAEYGDSIWPSAVLSNLVGGAVTGFTAKFTLGNFYADSCTLSLDVAQIDTVVFRGFRLQNSGNHLARCTLLVDDDNPANDLREKWVEIASGWKEMSRMPLEPSGKPVKRGGWLAYSPGNDSIFAAKGYKTNDFYAYDLVDTTWWPLSGMPYQIHPLWASKPPRKGARGVCDGIGAVYATQGNNTLAWWKYVMSADTAGGKPWAYLTDVPLGPYRKKIKGGTDLVYVPGDTGFIGSSRICVGDLGSVA
jgi:hypothetical protein